MVEAFLLLQTEIGQAANVVAEIRKLPGVHSADNITGSYDAIVKVSADDADQLGKLVVSRVQAVEGITRTITCAVVNL